MPLLDSTLITPLLILAATAVWAHKLFRAHQFRQFALQHGCEPPPHSASQLPWGLDLTWRMVRLTNADADIMETIFQPGFARFGWTFSSTGLLGERVVLTADPANTRAILSTQFNDFLAGADRIDNVGFVVGRCIFTVDGPFWERSRALFRPHFARAEINDLEATERAVQDLFMAVDASRQLEGEGGDDAVWTPAIDLQKLFLRFTLDTGTGFFFGANVKSQLAAIPGDKGVLDETTRLAADSAGDDGLTFSEAYSVAFKEIARRARLSSLSWLADLFPGDAPRAVRYLERFIDRLVDDAQLQNMLDTITAPAETGKAETKKPSFLQALVQTTPDRIEVRDQAHFMLAASRDTTASLLSWLFLLLAKHPAQLARLRAAITADFGTATDSTAGTITAQALKKCAYLQWAMAETLRLHPPGALNGRIAAHDTTLPTGGGRDGTRPIAIRKGQTVTIVPYTMHRRRDLFGEDAAEFRPERWEGKKVDWGYVPFSGGPRACLGKEYALAEAGYLTVRLLQRFDRVEPVDDLIDMPQKVTVTLQPSKGVNVRLRRAVV
ncbi:cytochrome P450 [Podospora appendiculata]|uniref:Cytochrome P450 n=1 Tax=Podospora appendiculata TaxID=314037 RepID=A0AAE0X7E1_9PEZI|nr:cytochrome P450 [Podospora appendiculata]